MKLFSDYNKPSKLKITCKILFKLKNNNYKVIFT